MSVYYPTFGVSYAGQLIEIILFEGSIKTF